MEFTEFERRLEQMEYYREILRSTNIAVDWEVFSSMPSDGLEKVMVIVAHPDDAEFVAAGTIAKWAREGREITYVIVTDGSKGSEDPEMTPQKLTKIREAEQKAAAKILGAKNAVFLGYSDGELQPTMELRRRLTRVIRQFQPDIVLVQDPTVRFYSQTYMNHPDHRVVGDVACDAIFPAARDRLNFPELLVEGLLPHKVKEVYLFGTLDPDTWVDIESTLETKLAALREHRSQIADFAGIEQLIRTWAGETAQGKGMLYAEGFRRLIMP